MHIEMNRAMTPPLPSKRMSAPRPTIHEQLSATDEAALVERLKRGEDDAFETMIRLYGPRLLAVARRILHNNEDDAQDALQDALLAAARKIDTFHADARLSTWLHRVTVNAALMKLRTRRRRPEISIDALLPRFKEDGHQIDPPAPWDLAPDAPLRSAETAAAVRAAIHELPDAYRTVLLLRDIEGLDTAESAEALGISENAVKTRLHRARQALRTLLEQRLPEIRS